MKALWLASLAACVCVGTADAASLITNGSFEYGVSIPTGSFVTVNGGDTTSISGWTVGGASVDYIGTYWQASNGVRSIDLSGDAPGSISQSFQTILGQTYRVSFDLAGNPDGGPNIKTGNAVAVGLTTITDPLVFDTTNQTRANMGWASQSFTFVGDGKLDTLTFSSTTGDPYGPALDNVAVAAVPLPASLPLFGGSLLALAGFAYGLNRWVAPKGKISAV